MPFQVEERAEVLWLTLDTPGASVNIFNRATAAQTVQLMRSVDPRRVRAVVIRTAKPDSFINGAGVLLVTYVKTPQEVERESLPYRRAYAAVRDCPVPTVAAIDGSCWGCGLEFALQCDHRIASDSYATQFRMTELSDYVEVPLLGSTRYLPGAVGMRRAIDLLLWGERWDAAQALREGLVQEVGPHAGFAPALDAFVRRVLRGEVPSQKRTKLPAEAGTAEALARARARIETIPPLYQRTFTDTLDLLELTSRGEVGEEHERQALLATTASTTHPSAKAAYGMFHVRQTAATLAAWRASAPEHGIALGGTGPAAVRLFEELRARQPLPEVRILAERGGPGPGTTVLVDPGQARAPEDVEVTPALAPPTPGQATVCWPLEGRPFLELHAPRSTRSELARALQRAGFEVALSGGYTYGSHQMLGALLAPAVTAILAGETPHTVDRTLRELGMFRRMPELIGALGIRAAAELASRALGAEEPLPPPRAAMALALLAQPADYRQGREAPELLEELLLWLLMGALESDFSHPSSVDLAARELLDFPVARLSLCAYLTPPRVRAALNGAPRRVPAPIRARALSYAWALRKVYR